MVCPTDDKMTPEEIRASRIAGCLLGGAVGDALGYEVEFYGKEAFSPSTALRGYVLLRRPGIPPSFPTIPR